MSDKSQPKSPGTATPPPPPTAGLSLNQSHRQPPVDDPDAVVDDLVRSQLRLLVNCGNPDIAASAKRRLSEFE